MNDFEWGLLCLLAILVGAMVGYVHRSTRAAEAENEFFVELTKSGREAIKLRDENADLKAKLDAANVKLAEVTPVRDEHGHFAPHHPKVDPTK